MTEEDSGPGPAIGRDSIGQIFCLAAQMCEAAHRDGRDQPGAAPASAARRIVDAASDDLQMLLLQFAAAAVAVTIDELSRRRLLLPIGDAEIFDLSVRLPLLAVHGAPAERVCA